MSILKEHKGILLAQSENKTLSQWVDFFNGQYTKHQIHSFCYHNRKATKKLSKEEKANTKKYHINQDYFKTWSNNMAYVLGLWFADGCIYGGKMFDITLHKKDKYILKQVAKELQYKGDLYDYVDNQAARLNFSCAVIYNDIKALGGTECKSKTIEFPKIPKEYLSDFIRGYFDGKGNIMNLKNDRVNCTFTCDSKKFLDRLLEILRKEAGVKGGSYDPSCTSLKFGKKDSIKIGDYMYKNNPKLFLLRKKEKFEK